MSLRPHEDSAQHAAALAEDVDLPLDQRREILVLEARLDVLTHFDVLGLPWGAGPDEARQAYLERVKRFHPDRYAGRRLGSFKARLDRITRRLTEARDVLGNEPSRTEYARRIAPPAERARLAAQQIEEDQRAEERRARLARTNPLLARVAQVAELVARGKAFQAAGKLDKAAADFQTALALDPRNPEIRRLAQESVARRDADHAQDAWVAGQAAEASGRDAHALDRFKASFALDPASARAAVAAVRVALRLDQRDEALALAQAAVRAAPRDGSAHAALGAALAARGDKAEAKRALERALSLEPGHEEAKALLRKLKWSLFG